MHSRHQKDLLHVCVVAENRLAAAYLSGALNQDQAISSFCHADLLAFGASRPRKADVFVIDQFGFTLPLSECLAHLNRFAPAGRFLILDRDLEESDIVNLLAHGIHGFLSHDQVRKSLVKAARFVAAGHYWVPPGVLETYLREAASGLNKARDRNATLTAREAQILELVQKRLSNREIASFLQIQVSTVKFHLSNILSKRQVSSRRNLFLSPDLATWKRFEA